MPITLKAESGKSRTDRILHRCVWGLALVPLASQALFWSLVLRARLELGRWPYVYHPDPKDIGAVHYMAYFYSVLGALLSPFLLAVVTLVAGVRQPVKSRQLVAAFLLCVGVLLGTIWMHRLDPWGFTDWIGD